MNIILGFGKTETDNEQKEREILFKELSGIAKKYPHEMDVLSDCLSDKAIVEIKKAVEKRFEKLNKQDKKYKENSYKNAPERYYFYFHHIVADIHDVFIGVKFFHINTRHPMSPDGIAFLNSEVPFWFKAKDLLEDSL